jgi:hypothetical protein
MQTNEVPLQVFIPTDETLDCVGQRVCLGQLNGVRGGRKHYRLQVPRNSQGHRHGR